MTDWEKFCSTGKIKDYLEYRGITGEKCFTEECKVKKKEEETNAGAGECYRNSNQNNTSR